MSKKNYQKFVFDKSYATFALIINHYEYKFLLLQQLLLLLYGSRKDFVVFRIRYIKTKKS